MELLDERENVPELGHLTSCMRIFLGVGDVNDARASGWSDPGARDDDLSDGKKLHRGVLFAYQEQGEMRPAWLTSLQMSPASRKRFQEKAPPYSFIYSGEFGVGLGSSSRRLMMHETEVHEDGGEMHGLSLDGSRLRTTNTQEWRRKIRLAIRALFKKYEK